MWPMRAAALAALAVTANAHGLMTNPAPRTGTTQAGGNKGNNAGPCGQNTANAGNPTATVNAGGEIELNWEINARHGGDCEISYAPGAVGEPNNLQSLTPRFDCGNNGNEQRTVTLPPGAADGPGVLQWQWDGDAPYFSEHSPPRNRRLSAYSRATSTNRAHNRLYRHYSERSR